ncbi:MAG: hypothetical protein ACQEUT_12060 [Bacillota bacterium]
MDNKDLKWTKNLKKLFEVLVGLAVLFLFIQWDNTRSKIESYEQMQVFQIHYQLNEMHAVFHSVEETLNTYEFPVEDNLDAYYKDAITKDIQRIRHIGRTFRQLNNSEFMSFNENYFNEIENIFKELRGFRYSDEEKDIAVEALSEVQSDLHSLLNEKDFSVKNTKDREQVLDILKDFIEKLDVMRRY